MIGRTVSHYLVLEPLGAGGMGTVYKAQDTRLNRLVALKFLSRPFSADNSRVRRFQREIQTLSALNHPGICTVYDVGEADGLPFIVMELLIGETLKERIKTGALKKDEVVEIGCQLAAALDAAHSQQIIHRDIKPANIFQTTQGYVKILDFSLAKLLKSSTEEDTLAEVTLSEGALTRPRTLLGTVAYMSPEQVRCEPLDGRSDLFSLGVVLYEIGTGKRPFSGTTEVLLNEILTKDPVPLRQMNADLPVEFSRIIEKALEKDKKLRYQSASELCADLKTISRHMMLQEAAGKKPRVSLRLGVTSDKEMAELGAGSFAGSAAVLLFLPVRQRHRLALVRHWRGGRN